MKISALWSIFLSMCTAMSIVVLIFIGSTYVNFKNSFVYKDVYIEVVNNPVPFGAGIEFEMTARKRYECNSTKVYGLASLVDDDKSRPLLLDVFLRHYVQNSKPSKKMTNSWTLEQHKDMIPGVYRVEMIGEFTCRYLMFSIDKTQSYRDIHLVLE